MPSEDPGTPSEPDPATQGEGGKLLGDSAMSLRKAAIFCFSLTQAYIQAGPNSTLEGEKNKGIRTLTKAPLFSYSPAGCMLLP